MEINNTGLIIGGVFIFLGLCFLGVSLRIGITRNAAINNFMTPEEYIDWVDELKKYN